MRVLIIVVYQTLEATSACVFVSEPILLSVCVTPVQASAPVSLRICLDGVMVFLCQGMRR